MTRQSKGLASAHMSADGWGRDKRVVRTILVPLYPLRVPSEGRLTTEP
jgi:hypothetical protein